MKKILTIAVVAVTLVAGGLAFAAPTSATTRPKQLEVHVLEGTPMHVDELGSGLGPGDWLLFRDPVVGADGERIGTAVTGSR